MRAADEHVPRTGTGRCPSDLQRDRKRNHAFGAHGAERRLSTLRRLEIDSGVRSGVYPQRSMTGASGQSAVAHGESAQLPEQGRPASPVRAHFGQRAAALRAGLPFGAVMATAGASALAGQCGVAPLTRPLLSLAILQALWVSIRGIARHRTEFRIGWRAWWAVGPAHEHSGVHTVPLGLAVITSGLLTVPAAAATRWPLLVAEILLVVVWVSTVMAVSRFAWSLAVRGLDLCSLDGTWFLVPAVLLGAAIATDRLAVQLVQRWSEALRLLADASVGFGWFGYWALAALAGVRVWRHGLVGAARAPWWIAMGCAGLAAAALGQVLQNRPHGLPEQWLADAIVMSVSAAILLSVPVVLLSVRFLLWQRRLRGAGSWPPTFSTAVFAFGALQGARVLHASALGALGSGAAYATLLFWCMTTAWNLKIAYSAWSVGARGS